VARSRIMQVIKKHTRRTRNLGIAKKPPRKAMFGLGIVIVLAASIIVTNVETSRSCPPSRQYVCAYVFKPAPKDLLVDGEIDFQRLGESNLSKVRINPEQARSIADGPYSRDTRSRVVFESLGGYIDKNDIVHDWVGTKSWVPAPVPAYIVRISDLAIQSDGPLPVGILNRSENVIVNAVSGKIVAEITYN
jgi:hypothetical protein